MSLKKNSKKATCNILLSNDKYYHYYTCWQLYISYLFYYLHYWPDNLVSYGYFTYARKICRKNNSDGLAFPSLNIETKSRHNIFRLYLTTEVFRLYLATKYIPSLYSDFIFILRI